MIAATPRVWHKGVSHHPVKLSQYHLATQTPNPSNPNFKNDRIIWGMYSAISGRIFEFSKKLGRQTSKLKTQWTIQYRTIQRRIANVLPSPLHQKLHSNGPNRTQRTFKISIRENNQPEIMCLGFICITKISSPRKTSKIGANGDVLDSRGVCSDFWQRRSLLREAGVY